MGFDRCNGTMGFCRDQVTGPKDCRACVNRYKDVCSNGVAHAVCATLRQAQRGLSAIAAIIYKGSVTKAVAKQALETAAACFESRRRVRASALYVLDTGDCIDQIRISQGTDLRAMVGARCCRDEELERPRDRPRYRDLLTNVSRPTPASMV